MIDWIYLALAFLVLMVVLYVRGCWLDAQCVDSDCPAGLAPAYLDGTCVCVGRPL